MNLSFSLWWFQIVYGVWLSFRLWWCQIVLFCIGGVKLSFLLLWCQIVLFVLMVSNCPFCYYGVKLSYLSSWCQIVLLAFLASNCPRCQIVLSPLLQHNVFESVMKYLLPILRALTVVYYPMYCRFFIASKTDSRQFIKII